MHAGDAAHKNSFYDFNGYNKSKNVYDFHISLFPPYTIDDFQSKLINHHMKSLNQFLLHMNLLNCCILFVH